MGPVLRGLSMDEAALARELMSTYRAEARERLEAVTRLLLDLEQAPTGPAVASCVEQIFREVHSLKGAARSVSEPAVEESAHAFENTVVAAVARGTAAASALSRRRPEARLHPCPARRKRRPRQPQPPEAVRTTLWTHSPPA